MRSPSRLKRGGRGDRGDRHQPKRVKRPTSSLTTKGTPYFVSDYERHGKERRERRDGSRIRLTRRMSVVAEPVGTRRSRRSRRRNLVCHREANKVGRGDPAPRHARGLELVETAGLLRRFAPRNDSPSISKRWHQTSPRPSRPPRLKSDCMTKRKTLRVTPKEPVETRRTRRTRSSRRRNTPASLRSL
jgi:hypothetical protein